MNTYQKFLSGAYTPMCHQPYSVSMDYVVHGICIRRDGVWGALQANAAHARSERRRRLCTRIVERML